LSWVVRFTGLPSPALSQPTCDRGAAQLHFDGICPLFRDRSAGYRVREDLALREHAMHDTSPSRRDLFRATGAAALAAPNLHARQPAKPPGHLPVTKPEDIGIDAKRLKVAYDLLDKWTAGKDAPVPGGAILVGRRGKVLPPHLAGRQGPEPDAKPIRKDGLFLMASITKPVIYTAAMILVERGQLNLTDRVTRYVPEFKEHGKDSVLVGHLFTHTSGLPDMLDNNAELRKKHAPIQTFLDAASKEAKPLFKPGTKLSYQSMGTAVIAEIIQRLSKQTIADFLKKELFDPLGLKDTALGSKGFDRDRLVRVEVQDYQEREWDWNSRYWQELGAPWGGLYSTPEDFAVICQLMLGGGKVGDVRLLAPSTVRMMTANRLDDYAELPEGIRRTQPWGLGWRLNHPGTPGSWGDALDRSVFGHTGATGTTVWMDPKADGFCILLTNALREKAPWRLVHLSNAVAAAMV
jgi:CubicO group peptidase (beta-lactamase class C family)